MEWIFKVDNKKAARSRPGSVVFPLRIIKQGLTPTGAHMVYEFLLNQYPTTKGFNVVASSSQTIEKTVYGNEV